MTEVEQLKNQLTQLQTALQAEHEAAEDAKKDRDKAKKILKETEEKLKNVTTNEKPLYISPGRRLEIFHGKPTKSSDIGVREWISDVRAQLELRSLNEKEGAAFVKEHLSGEARKEISGRGESVSNDPEKIFEILKVLATIPYFKFYFSPHLVIYLQFRDPSYVLNISTKTVLQKWHI